MPWFITSIASNVTSSRNARTFGFYNEYHEAWMAVRENRCNMQECLYDFLVVELIEQGIHPAVLKEEWYAWNVDAEGHGQWMRTIKPLNFEGITNWALG